MPTFVKERADAPDGFFAWEAAGLGWLAAGAGMAGGIAVVAVQAVDRTQIRLDRVATAPATRAAAEAFGRSLARTHRSGAPAFGSAPPGWRGEGWIGRQRLPIRDHARWGEFYAADRLLPYARAALRAGTLSAAAMRDVERVAARLAAGEFDDDTPPARIHGDLWGGNVLYGSPDGGSDDRQPGAVLIDPAAHGGHGLTDLAMLALFGTEYLERVQAAYVEAAAPRSDWPELIGLHQLHPLLVHAVTHGPGYGLRAGQVASRYT